jgi:methylmalonyl-CoA mutase N-terminal domain/subunit
VRAERDGAAVTRLLKALKTAAQGDANLMESIIECVENYATIGEICSTLAEVFGEATEMSR